MITMAADQVRSVLAALAGYWPTPVLTEEETVAWTTELVGPARIGYPEALAVIKAECGRQWRPRAGEFVALVQHYRRQEALRKPRPALPSGVRIASREMSLEQVAKCRELLKCDRTSVREKN
jgi:hypothetical protein